MKHSFEYTRLENMRCRRCGSTTALKSSIRNGTTGFYISCRSCSLYLFSDSFDSLYNEYTTLTFEEMDARKAAHIAKFHQALENDKAEKAYLGYVNNKRN